jgi:hypothetical protein
MDRAEQPSLFSPAAQPDLFGADAPAPAYRPDPDKVRSRLHRILAEAQAAATMPWEPTRLSLYKTIFPEMSRFLADEEAAKLRLAFEVEIGRLQAA